jgi:hypothetical protein
VSVAGAILAGVVQEPSMSGWCCRADNRSARSYGDAQPRGRAVDALKGPRVDAYGRGPGLGAAGGVEDVTTFPPLSTSAHNLVGRHAGSGSLSAWRRRGGCSWRVDRKPRGSRSTRA